nr:hypothetical protein [Tanacetum cinerariifolium]
MPRVMTFLKRPPLEGEGDKDMVDYDEDSELMFRCGDGGSMFIDLVFKDGVSLDEFKLFGMCCSWVCVMDGFGDIDVEHIIEAAICNSLVVVLKITGKWYEDDRKSMIAELMYIDPVCVTGVFWPLGKDCAKISKKQSKPNNIEHEAHSKSGNVGNELRKIALGPVVSVLKYAYCISSKRVKDVSF